ncbi:hypothetical protein EDD22DRAFT_911323 [Suillus occidentalis]|nr:hypothetical protein EDD22DRAFT_911323 [Suillus occidentalis]
MLMNWHLQVLQMCRLLHVVTGFVSFSRKIMSDNRCFVPRTYSYSRFLQQRISNLTLQGDVEPNLAELEKTIEPAPRPCSVKYSKVKGTHGRTLPTVIFLKDIRVQEVC